MASESPSPSLVTEVDSVKWDPEERFSSLTTTVPISRSGVVVVTGVVVVVVTGVVVVVVTGVVVPLPVTVTGSGGAVVTLLWPVTVWVKVAVIFPAPDAALTMTGISS